MYETFEVPTVFDKFQAPFTYKEVFKLPGYRESTKSRPSTAKEFKRKIKATDNIHNMNLERMKELGM